ncbi:hypothetical protein JOE49_004004 [Paenibacillus sp. PvR133]|jgi:hypothetical protein|uniref:hypothetical protein n=1 Tax=Paenibacillus sp. PvR133 TaxID=2806598 RepID=UPI001AEAFED0|nr:hypothetical protein [Paenibacillus sp. PvR133]MBP1176752.1 hypothetical protein [Paenibacillus sp. PvR133]
MRTITINGQYIILYGVCAEIEGRAVGYDSIEDRVTIVVGEEETEITTYADNVKRMDQD